MTQNAHFAKLLVLLSFLTLGAVVPAATSYAADAPAIPLTGAFKAPADPSAAAKPTTPASPVAPKQIPDRILGKASAPITVEEFVSLTCSHCAEFYNDILPEIEKQYVDTGKVKFILRDFPLDGNALKAAVIARCMPEEQYYPFIKILYKNQMAWAFGNSDPEKTITQYARLGGLSDEKAKACSADTALQDAVIAERTDSVAKYNIEATPTFVFNGGAETVKGALPLEKFTAIIDRLLAEKH